jgi:hypothetical protein
LLCVVSFIRNGTTVVPLRAIVVPFARSCRSFEMEQLLFLCYIVVPFIMHDVIPFWEQAIPFVVVHSKGTVVVPSVFSLIVVHFSQKSRFFSHEQACHYYDQPLLWV